MLNLQFLITQNKKTECKGFGDYSKNPSNIRGLISHTNSFKGVQIFRKNDDLIYNVGAEYWYADLIALRTGYNYDKAGSVKYLTFGAGLRYATYQFDFGYIAGGENSPLNDTMRFSLTIGR